MKDKKVIKHIKKLGKYCKGQYCSSCIFRDFRFENRCPIAVSLRIAVEKGMMKE